MFSSACLFSSNIKVEVSRRITKEEDYILIILIGHVSKLTDFPGHFL